eukprot:COSAG02_NODE_3865_length_6124_cov_27.767303_4_plen_342_part_00
MEATNGAGPQAHQTTISVAHMWELTPELGCHEHSREPAEQPEPEPQTNGDDEPEIIRDSPSGAGERDDEGEVTLEQWLGASLHTVLGPYLLDELGADEVDDMRNLEAEQLDILRAKLKPLPLKRFNTKLTELMAGATPTAHGSPRSPIPEGVAEKPCAGGATKSAPTKEPNEAEAPSPAPAASVAHEADDEVVVVTASVVDPVADAVQEQERLAVVRRAEEEARAAAALERELSRLALEKLEMERELMAQERARVEREQQELARMRQEQVRLQQLQAVQQQQAYAQQLQQQQQQQQYGYGGGGVRYGGGVHGGTASTGMACKNCSSGRGCRWAGQGRPGHR